MRSAIGKVVLQHEWALQMHGFYVDQEKKTKKTTKKSTKKAAKNTGVVKVGKEKYVILKDFEKKFNSKREIKTHTRIKHTIYKVQSI